MDRFHARDASNKGPHARALNLPFSLARGLVIEQRIGLALPDRPLPRELSNWRNLIYDLVKVVRAGISALKTGFS